MKQRSGYVSAVYYIIYLQKKSVSLCPGDVCTEKKKEAIQYGSVFQIIVVAGFIFLLGFINMFIQVDFGQSVFSREEQSVVADDCIPPQWAIDMGDEDIYKLHHGCEN